MLSFRFVHVLALRKDTMLIEFSVANFKSFKTRQTLNMSKMKGDEFEEENTFKIKAHNDFELLRSSVIYGANASGKSNFLNAIEEMRRIVIGSAAKAQRGDLLPVSSFRLDPALLDSPSEFEVVFIVDKVRYQYGFTATKEKIIDEWLIAYPKGRPQKWILRSWVEEKNKYEWDIGPNLFGEKQLWMKSTRENALFLSTAVNLNSQQLQPVFDWFKTTLRTAPVGGWGTGYSASLCENEEKKKVLEFLKAADLGIEDIEVESEPFDPSKLPDDLPKSIKEQLSKDMKDASVLDIKTKRKDSAGNYVFFDLEEESNGTRRVFDFAGPWLDSLQHGYVIFIDELHDSLHPKLVKFLVSLFNNKDTNPHNAQLVFTTHETSILSQKFFRRDQVWFCDKNENNESEIYSLTEFSPRKGKENIELSYLSGRYGAVPFTKNFNFFD